MELHEIRGLTDRIRDNVAQVIVGKEEAVELILIALITGGHVLLEDVPGTGKTLLAKTIARSLDCSFKRVQFTPDLLPSDISGINFFNQKSGEFEFRAGPLFAHILLADEINRATPRTQSSLLEAMEERQVSVDGDTRALPDPFLVIATQNPVENQGTFPLPEAQLDRFLLKLAMGYPSTEEGVELLIRFKEQNPLASVRPVADRSQLVAAGQAYSRVRVSEDLLRYLVEIAEKTRIHPELSLGVSPRGTQALLRSAQALAVIRGRDYVLPDDIKKLVKPVFAHRLVFRNRMNGQAGGADRILDRIVADTVVPAETGIH
ncbi:AAA family ATPase [Gorillibacterium timonense]|uniref:AAA family ATPase n=1 Tax=Gorillibacterium timonense TaxID=1689269 RepID=UPI00071E0FB7|nr:MoxR family ATPase [Gorillibacterium timonense]